MDQKPPGVMSAQRTRRAPAVEAGALPATSPVGKSLSAPSLRTSSGHTSPTTATSPKRPFSWRARNAARYVLPYPLKIANYIGLQSAILHGKANHPFFPVKIGVEISSRCNLSCPLCPRSAEGARAETGNMDWLSYTRLIDALAPYLFHVRLHNLGEPTLHPLLPRMVHYAHRKGIYTNFHTNGQLLDEPLVAALLSSGLDEIFIALDGMCEETYQQYRRGGRFERVRDGIVRMCSAKRRRRLTTPKVNIQFLVMSHNEHEVDSLLSFAKAAGVDRVQLKSVNIAWGEDAGNRSYLPANPAYSRYRQDQGRLELREAQKCTRVFSEMIVNWDGSVCICPSDHPGSARVTGNVLTDGVRNVLRSDEYIAARRTSLKRGYDMCGLCLNGETPV